MSNCVVHEKKAVRADCIAASLQPHKNKEKKIAHTSQSLVSPAVFILNGFFLLKSEATLGVHTFVAKLNPTAPISRKRKGQTLHVNIFFFGRSKKKILLLLSAGTANR